MSPIWIVWKKRILYLSKLYYKFISFQVDGVILIYTLGLVGALGFSFKEILVEIFSRTATGTMVLVPQMLLLLILLSGNLSGYLKMADQVFLSPLNVDGKSFLKYSHRLSSGIHLLTWFFLWSLICLYYRFHFGTSIGTYLLILIVGAAIRWSILNFKFALWNNQGKWRRRIYKTLFYGIASNIIGYTLKVLMKANVPIKVGVFYLVLLGIIFVISYFIKKYTLIDWDRLISEETNKRVQNFTFLLRQPYNEKKSTRIKTVSIFSGSKMLPFNEKGALLLLYFKTLQRGKGNLTLLLQIYFFTLGGMAFGDRVIDASTVAEGSLFMAVGFIFVSYLVGAFLFSLWINLKEDTWFRIYPYSRRVKISAIKLGPTLVLILFLLLTYIPISLIGGSILHPILDLMGLGILSLIIMEIQGYVIGAKLNIY